MPAMEALLLYGATERYATLRHEVPLAIVDPLLFVELDGRRAVLTTALELDRIAAVLPGVRAAQRAAEAGMAAAAALLRAAEPGDGDLHLDGEVLTAERVRAALRAACADHGAPAPPDVMVQTVRDGTGHEPGSGPLCRAPDPDRPLAPARGDRLLG